jgi:tetratricopeptide (TPR) repeat protein
VPSGRLVIHMPVSEKQADGWRARIATTVLLGLILALASPAIAADEGARDRARVEVGQGVELLGKRAFAAALERFESALALYPSPKIYYNIALAHEGLGNREQAMRAFQRFLAETPDPPAAQSAHARDQLERLTKETGQKWGPADAARSNEAEALVRRGVELRKERKDLEAYDYFRRAFETSATARTMAQLGLVEYQLGRWVDAEVHLDQAARSREPWIDQNRRTIAAALETVRSHIAYIEIKGAPAGAEVMVNDRKVGKLPLPGLVKTGEGHGVGLHSPLRPERSARASSGDAQYQAADLRSVPSLSHQPI